MARAAQADYYRNRISPSHLGEIHDMAIKAALEDQAVHARTCGLDRTLDTFPAEKPIINPDCGLRHLPAVTARAKPTAMVEGTVAVRRTLQAAPAQQAPSPEPTVEQVA